MSAIYDVFSHRLGRSLEESVAEALKSFQARHGRGPAAVWVNPAIAPAGTEVCGLALVHSRHMNSYYVYLELPASERTGEIDEKGEIGKWKQPELLPF